MRPAVRTLSILVALAATAALAACSGGQSDLQQWIDETLKKPGGRIAPLP